jgi:ketosteroid isomerase-like protein
MKQLLRASLLLAGALYLCAQAKPAKNFPANAVKPSVEQTLMQMERDWGAAEIKKDYAAVERILADDWVGIDYSGNIVPKEQAIADLKSGTSTLASEVLGPMTVRVFGNTAVVTGSDTEKSTDRGKDSTGSYVWTVTIDEGTIAHRSNAANPGSGQRSTKHLLIKRARGIGANAAHLAACARVPSSLDRIFFWWQ